MARAARQLAYGLVAGALLSAMRAPAGLDLVHLALPSARDAALFRAAALLAAMLPIDPARRAFQGGVRPLALLLGAALGFAGHGLFLAARLQPETRAGFAFLLLAGTGALFLAAGGRAAPAPPERPALGERLGLLLVGVGLAVAFEHLARYARLFAVGLPEDDALLGTVLLGMAAVGALAFGPLVARRASRGHLAAALGALACAATAVGLRLADHLETNPGRDPLYNYLGRFGLDQTQIGTLPVTALLGAAFFCVPALALGTTLAAARDARRLASLGVGAALGTFFVPFLMTALQAEVPRAALGTSTWSFGPWAVALGCAVLGAAATLRGAPRAGSRTAAGVLLALALAALLLAPRLAVWPFSPWYIVPIEPELALPCADGLLTVERERGGALVATLDRRLLTPTVAKEDVDRRRIEWSLGLLPPEARAARPRVLFVGQMTPARASVFAEREAADGPLRLERCVPWQSAAAALDRVLFAGESAPPGTAVEPAEALRRVRAGDYDLVLVAPIQGPLLRPKSAYVLPWGPAPAPATAALAVPSGTLAVAWIDAGAPLAARPLGARAMLAARHFDDLTLGLVLGDAPLAAPGARAPLLAVGEPVARPSGWSLLRQRADLRAAPARTALCERLARANEGGEAGDVARGLALHYAAQRTSSPFDGYANQIELVEDELRAFARASRERLDPLLRALWEDLAVLLAEKRRPDWALVYLEPLAERYGPWPLLERSVAHAYGELLMPEEALALLDRDLERSPYQIDLLVECARLAGEAQDPARRMGYLERALSIQPGHFEARVERAATRLAQGDPRGREELEALRAENPEEAERITSLLADEGPADEGPAADPPR